MFGRKEKKKEAMAAADAASMHEAPPPPYTEAGTDPYDDNDADFKGFREGARQVQAGTIRFPPSLMYIFKWSWVSAYLGPTPDSQQFLVTHPTLFTYNDTILYDGPDKKSPVIGSAGPQSGSKLTRSLIRVQPRGDRKTPLDVVMTGDYSCQHGFAMEVGGAGRGRRLEYFEWRSSRGGEVKQLANGKSYGYKLVRMGAQSGGHGGARDVRAAGTSSDGKEVVAVMAHTSKWKTGPKFGFLGRGLTGEFGEDWEAVAILSFLRVHEINRQRAAVGGAVAATV